MKTTLAYRILSGDRTGRSNDHYTDAEREFMMALDHYKRQQQRPFPTCSEVLAVLMALGYRKVPT